MSPTRGLEEFALLGDTRTAAILTADGSIDWLCLPRFDGPPVFGALVGGTQAGRFVVRPAEPGEVVRRGYRSDSAVTETRWRVDGGELRVTDGMVAEVSGALLPAMLLVRRIEALGRSVRTTILFDPRRGYSRRPFSSRGRAGSLVSAGDGLAVALASDPPIPLTPGSPCDVTVSPSRPLILAMTVAWREPLVFIEPARAWNQLVEDEGAWRSWASELRETSLFGDLVIRSLITLRLLTYSPSGAPVAAPTTSLPEHVGGTRNWDYRFAWPRDASLGVDAFLSADQAAAAKAFLYWLWHAGRLERPRLPALLTVYGQHARRERVLAGWPGFSGSTPVRVGNGAAQQHQLDGYGWVLHAGSILEHAGHRLYPETWRIFSDLADQVARTWREPDAGIWEVRGEPRQYVHSKLMGWLALDRALELSRTRRISVRRRARWERERAALAEDVLLRGVDLDRGTFVRSYGSRDLDAALLVLPSIGMLPPTSPLTMGTIRAVRAELSAGGPLLYRYRHGEDGLDVPEGAFVACSFWLVEALAQCGRLDEAMSTFEAMARLTGPFGLFGEQIDPTSGRHLGNYPQALSHAALVGAAFALDAAHPGVSSRPSAVP